MPPRRSNRTAKPTAKYSAYKNTLVKKTRKGPVAKAPLQQAIQRVINRNTETKYVMYRPYSNSAGLMLNTHFTQAINGSGEAYALIPPITIGDGDHQRTGNVIAPTSLSVKMMLGLADNMPDTAYIDVDVYCLTHKSIKDVAYQTQLGNFADLLNSGDGLNVGYDGSWTHSVMPVNTTTYNVLRHKRIRLSKAWGDVNTYISRGAPEGVGAYQEAPRHRASINWKIKCPKKLQYKSDADTTPTGFYPFIVIGWNVPTNLDTTSSLQIIDATATTHLYYKDA